MNNQNPEQIARDEIDKMLFKTEWDVQSKIGGNYFPNKKSKGATKAGLGLDDIIGFPVPLCSLSEQHQIVREIESRLSECDKVEESITLGLKKAFEGRLLSHAEIEKCKAEADYEPALVLLECIKKEKAHGQ